MRHGGVLFYIIFLFSLSDKCFGYEIFGQYIGCYRNSELMNESESFLVKVNNSAAAYTVENCLNECLSINRYRYGALQFSQDCSCLSVIEIQDIGNCSSTCPGNTSQICGGENSISVYATGYYVPGSPESLRLSNVTESKVEVRWSRPKATNGLISHYVVSAVLLETHASMSLEPCLEWNYPNSTVKAELLNLHPGTLYNISVMAVSSLGTGQAKWLSVWTHIGEPTEPEEPEVVARRKNSVVVRVKSTNNENGPVSAYRVIVISDLTAFFEPNNLKSWSAAHIDGIPYYIAAELTPENITEEFVVGDRCWYGTYFNPPLSQEKKYHITVGIRSTFEGITRYSYAKHKQKIQPVYTDDLNYNGDEQLAAGLMAAIIFSGLLLCGCIVTYFVIRRTMSYRRRRANYRQELTLQGPIIEVVNDGYIPEEIEERVDHYEKLQKQVWNIPRSSMELAKGDVLKYGRFGTVLKGVVQQRSKRAMEVPAMVYVIEDGKLSDGERKTMLQELGILIECGKQTNILTLIGTSEAPESLFVVLEYHTAMLKDLLLECRSLSHPGRFCSLPESVVLVTAIGIARGMAYMASKKIIHRQLAARNIAMVDGTVPKITGFGLTSFYKQNQVPDYTRWTAQEVLRKCSYTTKSDVWSFGCLLWEICALGGTPYSDVQNSHVCTRIIHGLRLPQARYVGDSIYQLMLDCWQLDLDERPKFQEIVTTLENVIERDEVCVELSFSAFPGFQYMPYDSESELQQ